MRLPKNVRKDSGAWRALAALILWLCLASKGLGDTEAMPEIVGDARFTTQVRAALVLLRSRDFAAYKVVTAYVGRIREKDRSGMAAYENPPTFDLSDTTAFYSVNWCAAVIAHDSFHSKLYHDYLKVHPDTPVPGEVWTGIAAEQQCMQHQLAVMQHIGASQWELDYAKTQRDGHYELDYGKRNW